MQIMTAKEAKTNFGTLLDNVQREPILVTRNSKPAGIFVSLEDIQGTYLAELFEKKQAGYDAWVEQQVSHALTQHKAMPTHGIAQSDIFETVMAKARQKLGMS